MKNKYQSSLIESGKSLNIAINGEKPINELINNIIKNNDYKSINHLYKAISEIIKSDDKDILQKSKRLHDALLLFLGLQTIQKVFKKETESKEEASQQYTLQELLNQLNILVGLNDVKEKVNDLIAFQKVQQLRRLNHLSSPKGTLHLAFMGNPGTGKTTVARIIGKIYKHLGLLSKGHFIEVSRTDLIAGYQGQTALKVKEVIEKAKGGVLFIDEAYSITENEHSDSYGRECLTELTKALEDYRNDLVVIVAGYTVPMQKFFDSNPGLRSRFNTFIHFEDYQAEELLQIFITTCLQNDYKVEDKALKEIFNILQNAIKEKDEQFSNGRFIRNFYENVIMNHAKRVSKFTNPTKKDLETILFEDL